MKKFLKKWIPDASSAQKQIRSKFLKKYLGDPKLWLLERHAIARGCAVGLLFAFLPLPLQIICSVAFAILLRANVPTAILMTWVTNPFTFVPFNLLIFTVGQWFTQDQGSFHFIKGFEFNTADPIQLLKNFMVWLRGLGASYLVGLPVVAISASILGFLLVEIGWSVWDLIVWASHKLKKPR